MKVLTIWQPWASLIIAGAKPYEFRSWKPPLSLVGQRIVIHSSARYTRMDEIGPLIRALEAGGDEAAMTCLKPDLALPILRKALHNAHVLPLGAGIGTAIVGPPRLGPEIAAEFGLERANDSDRDEHANWGWPMLEIEAWDEPVPQKGRQGLWNWPTPAEIGL